MANWQRMVFMIDAIAGLVLVGFGAWQFAEEYRQRMLFSDIYTILLYAAAIAAVVAILTVLPVAKTERPAPYAFAVSAHSIWLILLLCYAVITGTTLFLYQFANQFSLMKTLIDITPVAFPLLLAIVSFVVILTHAPATNVMPQSRWRRRVLTTDIIAATIALLFGGGYLLFNWSVLNTLSLKEIFFDAGFASYIVAFISPFVSSLTFARMPSRALRIVLFSHVLLLAVVAPSLIGNSEIFRADPGEWLMLKIVVILLLVAPIALLSICGASVIISTLMQLGAARRRVSE